MRNAGGEIKIFNNKLPSQGLTATYCSTEDQMKMEINKGIAGWDGKSPLFVSIQFNPWGGITPDTLVDLVNNYSSNSNINFVRTDNYFQLIRESKHMAVNVW